MKLPRWLKKQDSTLLLAVYVCPNKAKTQVVGEYQDHLKIALNAPAQDGKANQALIHFLSKILKTPKKDIQLLKGHKAKIKVLSLPADIEFQKLFN